MSDVMTLVTNPNQHKLVDIQVDLTNEQFSRFAFGGINALVRDETLHMDGDGGGPVIDPSLVILGLSTGALIYLILDGGDNNDGNKKGECQVTNFTFTTLNFDPCQCSGLQQPLSAFTTLNFDPRLNLDPCQPPITFR